MTIEEKKIALDALHYEVWMLNETSRLSSSLVVHPTSIVNDNAILESFLVHTRNLVYFLEDKMYSQDIRCSDFGVAGTMITLPPYNGIHEINKYLSHLTQDRIFNAKPHWVLKSIKEEVNDRMKSFVNQMDQSVFPTEKGKNGSDFIF